MAADIHHGPWKACSFMKTCTFFENCHRILGLRSYSEVRIGRRLLLNYIAL